MEAHDRHLLYERDYPYNGTLTATDSLPQCGHWDNCAFAIEPTKF